MSMGVYDSKRLKLLELLPEFWVQRIEDKFEGIVPTIFPDEAEIVAGTDEECIAVLKEYDLYSDAIELLMTGKGESNGQ